MKTVIITGGAGFIGSNFVRYCLENTKDRIVVLDKLTYAGNLRSLEDISNHPNYVFEKGDICDAQTVEALFKKYEPTALLNFAAETHVDRSIDGPSDFVQTNFVGTAILLDKAKQYYEQLNSQQQKEFRFLHVSTDEVYGTLGSTGLFSETTAYDPHSPYSATKAGADHLVSSYFGTYGFPVLITNCSNNYGPYQFPEKLIPLMILNAIEGIDLPIYGDGMNVRDWLYVEDHCSGIHAVLQKGKLGEKYNIGGENEKTNLQVIETLCDVLEDLLPADKNKALMNKKIKSYHDLKRFVEDRPGHDRRYAIDPTKIKEELGWEQKHNFESGLRQTVEWYLHNRDWCKSVQEDNYNRERLGLKASE